MKPLMVLSIAVMVMVLVAQPLAQIPRTIAYQGVLTDTLGNPQADAQYTFTFRLYDVPSGGSPLWSETTSLKTAKGLFSTLLGSITPMPLSLKFDKQYFLGTQVGASAEFVPRIPFSSSAYSFRAIRADTALVSLNATTDTSWKSNGTDVYHSVGNVGIGTSAPASPLTIKPVNGDDLLLTGSAYNADIYSTTEFRVGTHGGFPISLVTNDQFRLTVGGTGNVGIGTTTPAAPLTIKPVNGDDILLTGSVYNSDIYSTTEFRVGTHGSFPVSLVTDDQFRLTIGGAGNVGIGTTTPAEKLDVAGNLHVQGIVTRDYAAGVAAPIAAIAYGTISAAGTIYSATPNVSVAWSVGNARYEITLAGEAYFYQDYVTVVTTVGSAPVIAVSNSVSDMLLVSLYNTAGSPVQAIFSFVTYKR